jgi:hypothetical protein
LRRVAIDETAAKRGQDYISLFVDIDARKVVCVEPLLVCVEVGISHHPRGHQGEC